MFALGSLFCDKFGLREVEKLIFWILFFNLKFFTIESILQTDQMKNVSQSFFTVCLYSQKRELFKMFLASKNWKLSYFQEFFQPFATRSVMIGLQMTQTLPVHNEGAPILQFWLSGWSCAFFPGSFEDGRWCSNSFRCFWKFVEIQYFKVLGRLKTTISLK